MTFPQNWAYPTLKYYAVARNRTQPKFRGRKTCCLHIWVAKGFSERMYKMYIPLQGVMYQNKATFNGRYDDFKIPRQVSFAANVVLR
jgi:hypothetical protein